jgi:hypothetical protein
VKEVKIKKKKKKRKWNPAYLSKLATFKEPPEPEEYQPDFKDGTWELYEFKAGNKSIGWNKPYYV